MRTTESKCWANNFKLTSTDLCIIEKHRHMISVTANDSKRFEFGDDGDEGKKHENEQIKLWKLRNKNTSKHTHTLSFDSFIAPKSTVFRFQFCLFVSVYVCRFRCCKRIERIETNRRQNERQSEMVRRATWFCHCHSLGALSHAFSTFASIASCILIILESIRVKPRHTKKKQVFFTKFCNERRRHLRQPKRK